MKQILLLAIFSLLFNNSLLGSDKPIDIRLVSFGLYEEIKVIKVEKTDTEEQIIGGKKIHVVIKHLKTVDLINPEIGKIFGFEFKLLGKDDKNKEKLTIVHIHPEMTLPNGKKISIQYYDTKKSFNTIHHCNMLFEKEYELNSGIWTIQIFNDDIKILEKSFTLKEKRKVK